MKNVTIALAVAAASASFLAGFYVNKTRVQPYHLITWAERQIVPFNPESDSNYRIKTAYLAQYPLTNERAVLLGDSLTAMGNWDRLLDRDDIENLGIEGDTTVGILDRINEPMPNGAPVFLLAGVNDVNDFITQAQTLANLRQIVRTLSVSHKVYLQSTLLTRQPKANPKIAALDAKEKSLCEQERCTFIDLNGVLTDGHQLSADKTTDGVHLRPAGYRAWADQIKPLIPNT